MIIIYLPACPFNLAIYVFIADMIDPLKSLKSRTEVSMKKKFHLWAAAPAHATPPDSLPCGLHSCPASPCNHKSQFLVINLLLPVSSWF